MKILHSLDLLKKERAPVFLAAGFFDGVHLAHQKVLKKALAAAGKSGSAWAITFDQHPMKVLNPAGAPLLLTSTGHKLRLFNEIGLGGCVVLPFTVSMAALSPELFAEMLIGVKTVSGIFVGQNYTFGHGGKGNSALLQKLAAAKDVSVTIINPLLYRGKPISSTRIRKAVSEGRLGYAGRMLGRPFSVLGTVVKGRGLGTRLGIPTANLDPHNEITPPSGVYAGLAGVGGEFMPAVVNLGFRPTVEKDPRAQVLEVHILDAEKCFCGQEMEVRFVKKIRDEKKFRTLSDLRSQITLDIETARGLLLLSSV